MPEQKKNITYIGGQAAMEGVMMRGKTLYALAVRTPDKSIVIDKKKILPQKNPFLKLPIVRGVVSFISSMILGVKIIYDSAEKAGLDDLKEENPSKFDLWLEKKFGDKLFEYIMFFAVAVALVLGVGLFMLLPVFIASLINPLLGGSTTVLSVLEGLLRIAVFLLYIFLISKTKDIRRVFQYHGAEHKTISCYESGEELTPENAIKHTRLHKRCGTSFLFIVMLVSMAFFMLFPVTNFWIRLGSRILFVPIIAGISYEIIMWAGRSDNLFVNILSYPGKLLQNWTTLEPDLSQLEVAIAAMKAVLYDEPPETAVREAFEKTSARLKGLTETAELDASLIVSAATGLSLSEIITKADSKLEGQAYRIIDEMCIRRKKGEPMAYVLGKQDFMEHSFTVNHAVLIPRPDTEILVEAAYKYIREKNILTIIEIGSGSGCIAICLANRFPETDVIATDISPEALFVARNQKAVTGKLSFVEGDLFEALSEHKGQVGLVISNPPYIKSGEIQTLEPNVKDFEPLLALDGGADGLDFYRSITEQSLEYLVPGGVLMYEIGFDQGDLVSNIMKEHGFDDIKVMKDYAGLDRVVVGLRSNADA